MIITGKMALLVDAVYADPAAHGTVATGMAVVFFALQLYCDFSSYSDIAIGAARVMGFTLTRNFNAPYLAASIGEFWANWHVTRLSSGNRIPPEARQKSWQMPEPSMSFSSCYLPPFFGNFPRLVIPFYRKRQILLLSPVTVLFCPSKNLLHIGQKSINLLLFFRIQIS